MSILYQYKKNHSNVEVFLLALGILTRSGQRHLGNPLDLGPITDDGVAIAVLLKLDVPKVQDTGNDSKEMLIMGDTH